MGAECSIYKDYELEEPIETSSADWTLYPAHTRGDNGPLRKVTVFVHKKSRKERKQKGTALQTTSQFLKVLRHPAILKYYSSHNGSEEVAMVTEPVEPLDYVLSDLSVDEIIAGLYNIVEALEFLHDRCDLSHNNVSLSSVYVSVNDGSWKLGGMQCVCKFSEVNNKFLETTKPLRDTKSITPEEKDGNVQLTQDCNHSLDAYGFGMLVCDILDSRTDIGSSSDRFGELMQSSFLHHNPKMRPRLCSLIGDDFFRNNYLEVVSFLNNITIKTDIDKEKFFSTLVSKLQSVSCDVVARRLLPRLLCRFVLAEPSADEEFLPHILTPENDSSSDSEEGIQPILPMNLFKEYCVPILSKLWTIKDVHVRLILLKFFPLFASAYDEETLQMVILPQMLMGLRDTDDSLVSGTFHALAALVPLLGGEVVVGGERQKYFSEGRPKFSMGSYPQIKTNLLSSSSLEQKSKDHVPVNVLDALHMENKLKPREEKPSQIDHKDREMREQNKRKRKQEMEQRREELRREREIKKVEREKERAQQEELKKKTLLEVAKEQESRLQSLDSNGQDSIVLQSVDEDSDEWEDFPSTETSSEFLPMETKLKTSPTRFQSSNTTKYELTDIDFTPTQNTSGGSERDLISWDNDDFTSGGIKPEVDSIKEQKAMGAGKGMKLSSKKSGSKKSNQRASGAKTGDDLGSMFEVPDITVKSAEPDFFADMQPDLEFKRYDGGVGGGTAKSSYSAKLGVENMAQVEDGWDDDNWTDFG